MALRASKRFITTFNVSKETCMFSKVHTQATKSFSKRWLIRAASLLAVLSMGNAVCGSARQLSVEDVLEARTFGEISRIALSPDGRSLGYMVRTGSSRSRRQEGGDDSYVQTGVNSRNAGGQIWISDVESAEITVVSDPHCSSWDPAWSPDGQYLAFLSDCGKSGQARLWVWDTSTREARLAVDRRVRASHRVNPIEWTPDSRRILITVLPHDMELDQYLRRVSRIPTTGLREEEGLASPLLLRSLSEDGESAKSESALQNLDALYLHDLDMVDLQSGQVVVLAGGERIVSYAISPDGGRVAYAVAKHMAKPTSRQIVYDVKTIDLRTLETATILSNVLLDFVLTWSPDASMLAYGAFDSNQDVLNYFVIGTKGGKPRNLTAGASLPRSGWANRALWSRDGKRIYFLKGGAIWRAEVGGSAAEELTRIPGREIRNLLEGSSGELWSPDGGRSTVVVSHDKSGKQDGFFTVDLGTGRAGERFEEGQCYTCKWTISNASFFVGATPSVPFLAYVSEDAQHAPDLWIMGPQLKKPRQLTHLNPQLENRAMGRALIVNWLSDDGKPLQGALLLPPDYFPGKRIPIIVWSYLGIPYSESFNRFGFYEAAGPLNMQLFATRGYGVFFADVAAQAGRPAASLAKSVLPGVSKLVEMGIADPERIGVLGHSGAAFASVALIVQTKRFRAAVAIEGWGDFTAFYGSMQPDGAASKYLEAEQWYLDGSPWQYPFRYVENSPVFRLDEVDTPLLLVHGDKDSNVQAFLGDELFVGLRRLGKYVEYAKYRGESHVPGDWAYADQLDLSRRMIAWFGRYLQGSH